MITLQSLTRPGNTETTDKPRDTLLQTCIQRLQQGRQRGELVRHLWDLHWLLLSFRTENEGAEVGTLQDARIEKGWCYVRGACSKVWLNGAHHILLEGSTFPPEERSPMAQSMGPLRSEVTHREKWASAVKRAFNHITIIDDLYLRLLEIKDKTSKPESTAAGDWYTPTPPLV